MGVLKYKHGWNYNLQVHPIKSNYTCQNMALTSKKSSGYGEILVNFEVVVMEI
jgi:hypothetical protein